MPKACFVPLLPTLFLVRVEDLFYLLGNLSIFVLKFFSISGNLCNLRYVVALLTLFLSLNSYD